MDEKATDCTWLGLDGCTVVVTGAAGGIGAAVALATAAAGSRVALVDVDERGLEETRAKLARSDRHISISADLTDLDRHEALIRKAIDETGRFDALVHTAAVLRRRAVEDVTEADWDAQLDTNLKATFFLNRAAARLFREQRRGGAIVNFASQSFWSGGLDGAVVYAASKGAVVSMSRGLARIWAPDGIRVNTVAPGLIDTAMLRSGLDDTALANQLTGVPLGRLGEPEEVAAVVAFLCSDRASYVTGATLNVSGAQLLY